MLNKEKTANWARLKYLLAVPLGVGLLCVSTLSFSKTYGFVEIGRQKQILQQKSQKTTDEEDLAKTGRYSPNYIFDENKNYKSLEKRLIVINGLEVKDNNKYYGSNKADKILFLDSKSAAVKYGEKGRLGAVEIYGREAVLVYQPPYVIADTAKFPLPKPKQDQIKFPPTYKPKNQKSYVPDFRLDKKTGKQVSKEMQLIVINGQQITDNNNFYGVRGAESILVLSRSDAAKKYGEKGKYGAVEISGSNLTYLQAISTKPPRIEQPPKGTNLKKFPPPIAKPDKKASNTNSKKLVEETELALASLVKKEKVQEIKIVPTQKLEDIKIEETNRSNTKPATEHKAKQLEMVPSKKTESLKLVPTKNKKEANSTIVNISSEQSNSIFNKAWTLYKPKVEENKNDRC